jgi:hypothetical protein
LPELYLTPSSINCANRENAGSESIPLERFRLNGKRDALFGTLTTTNPEPGDTRAYFFCGGAYDKTFTWRVRSVAENGDFSAWSLVRMAIIQ